MMRPMKNGRPMISGEITKEKLKKSDRKHRVAVGRSGNESANRRKARGWN